MQDTQVIAILENPQWAVRATVYTTMAPVKGRNNEFAPGAPYMVASHSTKPDFAHCVRWFHEDTRKAAMDRATAIAFGSL